MSVIFRSVLMNKGIRWCASNSNFVKFNFKLPDSSYSHCRCKVKTLVTVSSTLRREYSTKSDAKAAGSDTKVKEKELIYTGLLSTNIRNIKFFSLSTSVIGLSIQPLVYTRAVAAGATSNLTLPAFAVVGAFAIITPLVLHLVTKRYVLSVDYVPEDDKYIATIYNLFAMKKEIEFTPEDVTIPTALGMFTTCAIKGKPVFIDSKSFTDQKHYARIMGYDKPLDLGVENNDDDDDDNEPRSKKKDA